ncbi:MAG: nucleotide exchange factor GrpE [Spirochaetia bacterium]|nr:nucleotide exchange factor GrpE [Spirochaetia bacterium]
MRTPIVQFPFIISYQQKNRGGDEEKLSLILKKLVFLESTLDELLEVKSLENDVELSSSLLKQEMEKFFIGLIPILDSLDAACKSAAESEEHELSSGLEMLNRKLIRHLASWKFIKSTDIGMDFDPGYHEAVGTSSSSLAPGLISDIIEIGWIFEGKILRFAKVIVGK